MVKSSTHSLLGTDTPGRFFVALPIIEGKKMKKKCCKKYKKGKRCKRCPGQ